MTRDTGEGLAQRIPEKLTSEEAPSNPTLDKAVQSRIGDQLRAMYDDLMQQPVPDRFRDLLAKLDESSREIAP